MSDKRPPNESPSDYGRQFAAIYDALFPSDAVTEAETTWIAGLASTRPRTIVELGVGTGRVALPLISAFALSGEMPRYIGVDASPEMLSRLASKDPDASVTPALADISSFDYPADVDMIICVCGTISMVVDVRQQAATIERAARALKRDGVLLIETHDDVVIREMHVEPQMTFAVPYPGIRRALVTFSSLSGRRWDLSHVWIDDGTATFPTERSRLTSLDELDAYASAAGLESMGSYRGLDGSPLSKSGATYSTVYRKR